MSWVNLLPWRAQRDRRRLRRECWLLAVLVLLEVFFALTITEKRAENLRHEKTVALWHRANQQATELQTRTAARIQYKQSLTLRLSARQQKQKQLSRWYDFLRNLPDAMPDELWLSELSKTLDTLVLMGFCREPRDVDAFRQRLQTLSLFRRVGTQSLRRDDNGRIKFSLLAVLPDKPPVDD
ncbi:PilN domain-containing protein [Erwinia tasmaniensis]|uniref:PilN domain-containing protein n=1 Tax=Erwinia tasmaniensis TaxID=338565 RepID=UPI003A4DFADF